MTILLGYPAYRALPNRIFPSICGVEIQTENKRGQVRRVELLIGQADDPRLKAIRLWHWNRIHSVQVYRCFAGMHVEIDIGNIRTDSYKARHGHMDMSVDRGI